MPLPVLLYIGGGLVTAAAGIAAYDWWVKRDKADDEPETSALPQTSQTGPLQPALPPGGTQEAKPTAPTQTRPLSPTTATPIEPIGGTPIPSLPAIPPDLEIQLDATSPSSDGSTSENPPNLSGDPLGYNTTRYPSSLQVRQDLRRLGYAMPEVDAPPPPGKVREFQEDYNQASFTDFLDVSGRLIEDDIAGKYTLRALEVAATGLDGDDIFDTGRAFMWKTRFHS